MIRPLIAPSLMCMDPMHAKEAIETMDQVFDLYHLDVMDSHFCPNMALTPSFANSVRRNSALPLDVHLMVEDPMLFVGMLDLGQDDCLSFQAETIERSAFRLHERIMKKGNRFGVVLSPSTPLSAIESYRDRIDLLTIMTIDTGFAGQRFIPEMLGKIEQAVRLRAEQDLSYRIQIDGQCNKSTFKRLAAAGSDILVVGNSGLFSLAPDLCEAIGEFKRQFSSETGVNL